MNVGMLSRLLWKEQRAQRSLWLAMAAVTSVCVLIVAVLNRSAFPYTRWFSAFVLLAPGFYAVGCAAVMFAGEKETGSFHFQAALPVSSLTVFAAKCVSAVLGAAALYAVLAVVLAASPGPVFPPASDRAALLLASILFCLEMLAWGIFYSLVSAHTLRSVVMATATASLCLNGAFIRSSEVAWDLQALAGGLSWRLVLAAVVLAVDTYLGARWTVEGRTAGLASRGLEALSSWRSLLSGRQSNLAWRLVWQQWRDTRGVYFVLALCYLFGVVLASYVGGWTRWTPPLLIGAVALIAVLIGATVFLTDQRGHQRRFLVERGVGPWELWFHRQIVGVFLTGMLGGIVAGISTVRPDGTFSLAAFSVAVVFAGYAVGQFCSMVISSPVLSCLGTLALLVPLTAWMYLSSLVRVPIWLGLVPVPVAFLIASRLHCYDWMREEVSWRSRSKLLAFGTVWSIAVIGGVLVYRVVEIPQVEYPPALRDHRSELTERQQKQYDVIVHAASSLVPIPQKVWEDLATRDDASSFCDTADRPLVSQERAWLEANAHVLKQLEVLHDPIDPRVQVALTRTFQRSYLRTLVILSARQLESEGKLEPALNHYLLGMRLTDRWPSSVFFQRRGVLIRLRSWAAAPGQTPELLKRAAQQVASANEELFPLGEEVLGALDDYWTTFLSTGTVGPLALDQTGTFPLLWWMPGERLRARRLIRLEIALEHAELEQLYRGKSLQDARVAARRQVSSLREEDLAYWVASTAVLAEHSTGIPTLGEEYTEVLWEERLTRLVMMLYAFRLENGDFPRSLDELVPDYLPSVPVNPLDGSPMHYCREGIDGLPEEIRTNPKVVIVDDYPRNVPTLYAVHPVYKNIELVVLGTRRER